MLTVKLEDLGRERRTVRVYGVEHMSEKGALKELIEARMSHNPLKVGDKIHAYKFYDTINTYKVSNICYDGSVEMRAI